MDQEHSEMDECRLDGSPIHYLDHPYIYFPDAEESSQKLGRKPRESPINLEEI